MKNFNKEIYCMIKKTILFLGIFLLVTYSSISISQGLHHARGRSRSFGDIHHQLIGEIEQQQFQQVPARPPLPRSLSAAALLNPNSASRGNQAAGIAINGSLPLSVQGPLPKVEFGDLSVSPNTLFSFASAGALIYALKMVTDGWRKKATSDPEANKEGEKLIKTGGFIAAGATVGVFHKQIFNLIAKLLLAIFKR